MAAHINLTLAEAACRHPFVKTWLDPILAQLPRVVSEVLQSLHIDEALAEMPMPAEVRSIFRKVWSSNSIANIPKLRLDKGDTSQQITSMARPRTRQMTLNALPGIPELECSVLALPCSREEITLKEKCSKEDTASDQITTLMLCDIPRSLSIHELVKVMKLQGFSRKTAFDLIYMPPPIGLPTKTRGIQHNLGHAVVNFKTPWQATAFAEAFYNFTWPARYSTKQCYTKPARCQGYDANWRPNSDHNVSGCLLSF